MNKFERYAIYGLGALSAVALTTMIFNQWPTQAGDAGQLEADAKTLEQKDIERIADERVQSALREHRLTESLFQDRFAEAVQEYSRAAQRQRREPQGPNQGSAQAGGQLTPVSDSDWVLGDLDTASVVLVEYGSYACSFCERAHPVFHSIVEHYEGEVAWVYRHFPLQQGGFDEHQAAIANCAGQKGGNEAFWAVSDGFYDNSIQSDDDLTAAVNRHGLNIDDIQTCAESEETVAEIREQAQAGRSAGVTGTPGNFLVSTSDPSDIRMIPGAQPESEFRRVIDSML